MIWVILLVSAIAVAVFIERVLHFHRAQINSMEFLNGVRNVLKRANVVEALSICEATPGPVARLVKAAIINRDKGRDGVRALEIKRRGRRVYALSHVYTPKGKRAKYLLSFAWTRFWDMSPRARLETLVHELYHIGPKFDGEPREFEQGGWHGAGRKWFDKIIHKICEQHLPHGLELEHPVLALEVEPGMKFVAEKLRRPNWEEVLRSL